MNEPVGAPVDVFSVDRLREESMSARGAKSSETPTSESNERTIINRLNGDSLELLRTEVADCRRCSILCSTRTQTVFADGSSKAELCFVGEAPGADEDRQGTPFVGRAGQLLTKIIEACGLRREEVYICNVLKCRPPDNRNPSPEEIENCRPYFERQLSLVRPKMMIALGKFAAASLLKLPPEKVPITRLRGEIRDYGGVPFMITLHPAYLLRNPSAKKDVWEDMKRVMAGIGRPIK
jgi:DNA polymerase